MSDQFTVATGSSVANSRSAGQIVGGVLLGVAGLLTLPDFFAQAGYVFSSETFNGFALVYFVVHFLGSFGLIAAGISGALKSARNVIIVGFGWFVLRLVASLLISVAVTITYNEWDFFSANLVRNLTGGWDWQGWLGFVASLLGVAAAVIALVVKPKQAFVASPQTNFVSQPQPTATATSAASATNPGWYFDPSVGAQRYWDGSAWLNIPAPAGANVAGTASASVSPAGATPTLAIVAFIFSLIMPLVGLILGYVARNQARVSNNPQAGASFIKAAIIIGWIFTALSVVGAIIYGVVLGSILSQSYSY